MPPRVQTQHRWDEGIPAIPRKGIGPWEYAKRTYKGFSDDDAMTLGAALAYYTVFSLAPLLLTVISIAGLIMGREAVQNQIQSQVQMLIGSGSAEQVKIMLTKATESQSGGVLGTIVGIVVLILGATGTFGSLQDALNKVWHVKPDPRAGGVKAFLGKRVVSFGMILGVAFLLLVSLALSAVLSAAGTWIGRFFPSWLSSSLLQVIGFVVSLVIISALFGAMFKILPDAELHWREVWVGAVVTGLLFSFGKLAIGLYIGKSATASAYGAAGSFVVIVVWLYYASLIMLFGAEFTKTWALEHGRLIEPEPGAVAVRKEEHHIRA
ncbi:MAG TPA: YihY/virulence factor BrkB family protein [Bryobacteraceae bacterium]|jgi:membrane protein